MRHPTEQFLPLLVGDVNPDWHVQVYVGFAANVPLQIELVPQAFMQSEKVQLGVAAP